MATDADYDDGGLVIDRDGLTIRRYYFPWAGPKRIKFSEIQGVETRAMGWLTGKGRGWGTAHLRYWLPLDPSRFRKGTLVVLDLGRRVMPAITPDDPDLAVELVRRGFTEPRT